MDLLVISISEAVGLLQQKRQTNKCEDQQESNDEEKQREHWALVANLKMCLSSTNKGEEILKILLRKLKQETQLTTVAETDIDLAFIIDMLSNLKALQQVSYKIVYEI